MMSLRVAEITPNSVSVEQLPEGHRWDFPVIHSDDNRRYLSHCSIQPKGAPEDIVDIAGAAYSIADAAAHFHHLVGN